MYARGRKQEGSIKDIVLYCIFFISEACYQPSLVIPEMGLQYNSLQATNISTIQNMG